MATLDRRKAKAGIARLIVLYNAPRPHHALGQRKPSAVWRDAILGYRLGPLASAIDCPVLALWGTQTFVGRAYEPLSVWQQYATDVRGTALPTGHFLPEEAPALVIKALRDFLD